MFNVGGWEFLVILVLALVVLGPDKLPEAARQFGKYSGQLREMARGFQKELDAVKSEFVELSDLSEAQARANGAAAVRDDKPGPRGNLHQFDKPNADDPEPDAAQSSANGSTASAERTSSGAAGDVGEDVDSGAGEANREGAQPRPRPAFDAMSAEPDRTEKPVAAIPGNETTITEGSELTASDESPNERPKLDGTEMI